MGDGHRPSLFVLCLRHAGAQKCTQKSSPRSSSPRCFAGSTPRDLSGCVSPDSLSRLIPRSTGRTYVVSGWGTGHFGANARTVDRTRVRAEPRKGPFPHPELRTIGPRFAGSTGSYGRIESVSATSVGMVHQTFCGPSSFSVGGKGVCGRAAGRLQNTRR